MKTVSERESGGTPGKVQFVVFVALIVCSPTLFGQSSLRSDAGPPSKAHPVPPSSTPNSSQQHNHSMHSQPGKAQSPLTGKVGDADAGKRHAPPPPVPMVTAPNWAVRGDGTQVPVYTLDTLLSTATASNPTLLQSRLHINAAMSRAVQAGLYPNPTVAVVGEQIGLDGTAGEWVGAEIEQTFVTAGKLRLSRNKYLQRAKVAEHLVMAQQFRVCNDIRIHFYRTLAAEKQLNLKRELLKTAEDHMLTTREMHNLGQANQRSVQEAIALLQKHRLAVMAAENHVRRVKLELLSLAGIDADDVALEGTLQSDQPLLNFDAAYAQLRECSPEVLAAHAKLREDCITLNREKVEWIPNINVSAGPGYNNIDRQTTVAARVAIEVPLFDRNQGTIDQAAADYNRQLHEIRRLQLDLRRRLAAEFERYLSAVQHVQELESVIVPAKREAYRLTLQGYKRSRSEWPDVLEAQEAYTNARAELVSQQSIQRVSETLVNGFLLHGGLTTPSGPVPGGHIDAVPKPR